MRNMVIHTIAISLILCSLWSIALGEQTPTSRPWYFHPTIGLTSPALGDVNDYLDYLGSSAGWDNFGMAPVFGLELGKQISETAFLGLRVAFQQSSISNSYQDSEGSLSYDPAYQLYDLSVRGKVFFPKAPGLYSGISVGYASGNFTEGLNFNYSSDPAENFTYQSEYSGSGVSIGGFVGYQFPVGQKIFLTGELGYKYRNLGTFEGTALSPQIGSYSGPALDNSGQEMDFDFSGLTLEIGIVFNMYKF